eukprot:TRINITY_DN12606_c0_g1_i1.p1 TRINITY_DN12606_c0_g1~~TRINITY_DN12606_c0_g1_i1.p1  ORF type:complete len:248 (-),score=126.93 TRINITY_DN12606_c0_g1_i1:260-931(-)
MPKKFGTNTKAEEANIRKKEQKKEAAEKKTKAAEDAKWAETDPKILRNEEKKKQEEEKQRLAAARRAEVKALEAKEAEELSKISKKNAIKVTQHDIQLAKEKELRAKEKAERTAEIQKKKQEKLEEDGKLEIEPNINHILREEREKHENFEEGRTVEDAIAGLAVDENQDRHPEKRLKAAFTSYEARNLPLLKEENPYLKKSQLQELLWKQWQKAPENPLNQA